MNALIEYNKEIAVHRDNGADGDPVLVSLCMGRALMRFRAEIDGSEPEHDDPEGYLRSCILSLMHYANAEGIDFAGELEWCQSAFAEDAGSGLCHGYTIDECKTHFVPEGVTLTDEQVREIMQAIAASDDDWIEHRANDARYEALEEAFQSIIEEVYPTA